MAELPETRRLEGISPRAYEHPADRAATAALRAIPFLDEYVRRLIELQYERALRQALLAGSIKIGPKQLPEVWERYQGVLHALDMPLTYDLYVSQWPFANAAAIGAKNPMIALDSRLLELADADEIGAVLAHETGHILSEHVTYRTALMIILMLGTAARLPLLAGLPLLAIRTALLEWSRASELSCDRAAALATRDPLLVSRTLMVLAAGLPSERLDLDAFLNQGTEYEEWDSGFDRFTRLFAEIGLTHSYPVRRVSELMKWVRSGDYDRILAGEYPRRDDPVSPRAEAGDAVDHYSDRFRQIFREAGDSVATAGGRLSDWLRGDASNSGDEHGGDGEPDAPGESSSV